MPEVFLAIPIFILSVVSTAWVKKVAESAQLLAIPTHRSSHVASTPVGGGLTIVLVYALTLAFLVYKDMLAGYELAVLCASLPIAGIGLIDDRTPVDFRVRLAIQIAGVMWVLAVLGALPPLTFGSLQVDMALATWILVPLALIWLTNLYNFMDGVDGIAGIEACCVTLAAGLLLAQAGDLALALICLSLFAASVGFLVWNWPPAKIFMGDVGSGFIGYTLGLVALLSHYHETMSLWSWVLLLAVFIVDATFTLVRRVGRGEPWYQAHRSHAYQHAAQISGSHQTVSVVVLLINLFWLIPLAWLASKHPEYGVYLAVLGIVPLVIVARRFHAGEQSTSLPGK